MENILTVRQYTLSKFVKTIAILSVALLIVIACAAILFSFKEFSIHNHHQSLVYVNSTSNSSQPNVHFSNQIIIAVNNSSLNSDSSGVEVTVSDHSEPVNGVTVESSTVEQPTSEAIPTPDDSATELPVIEQGVTPVDNSTIDSVITQEVDSQENPFDYWTPV